MEVFSGCTFFDSFISFLRLVLCPLAVSVPEAVSCSEEPEEMAEIGLVMELSSLCVWAVQCTFVIHGFKTLLKLALGNNHFSELVVSL